MKQDMTLIEIRQTGIELLTGHLGITGMMRFFQQAETGTGNYTLERQQYLGNPDVSSLPADIIKQRGKQQQ